MLFSDCINKTTSRDHDFLNEEGKVYIKSIECNHIQKLIDLFNMVCFRVKRTIPGRKMSQKSFTMSYQRPALLDPSPIQRQLCAAVDSLNSKRNYSSSEVKTGVPIPVRNNID